MWSIFTEKMTQEALRVKETAQQPVALPGIIPLLEQLCGEAAFIQGLVTGNIR